MAKRYLTGSKLLGLQDLSSDTDYIEIDEENLENYKFLKEEGKVDIFVVGKDKLQRTLTFEEINSQTLYNIFYDKTIRGSENALDFDYNLLDYKTQLIEFLKYIAANKLYNFNPRIGTLEGKIKEQVYLVAYNTFICANNSIALSEEQLQIIKDIHDGKKDIEYIATLQTLIYNL